MDGDTTIGQIGIIVAPDDAVTVETAALLQALTPLLSPSAVTTISAAGAGKDRLGLHDLDTVGVKLSFDSAALSLAVTINPDLRKRQSINLLGSAGAPVGTFAEPASFSGYLNIRSAFDYIHAGPDRGFATPIVNLDGAIRAGGFVLEGEGGYYPTDGIDNSASFVRLGTRLVYDDIDHVARYTLGDLYPTGRGFQNTPPAAGISILRSYSDLQPLRNVSASGSRTFTLVRPSTVETFVNNISVTRQRLAPGTYDLNNFPLAQGSNDVRVVVQDDTGASETLDFSLFYDRTLLQKGTAEFGAYAGIRARDSFSQRTYLKNEYLGTGYYRMGLTDRLTAGVNAQADRRVRQFGFEILTATPIGFVAADGSVSQMSNFGFGYAFNLALQSNFGGVLGQGQSINAFAEIRSQNFAGIGDIIPSNPYSVQASIGYSRAFGLYTLLSLDGQYSKGRLGEPDLYRIRLAFAQRFTNRLSLQAEVRYDRSRIERGFGGRISLVYRLGQRSSVRADYDTIGDRGRIEYERYGGDGIGAYNADARVEYSDFSSGVSGEARYNWNRAELGFAHDTLFDPNTGKIADQRTSLRVATSISFADGVFGIGRPIYDSFALVAPHPTLSGTTIDVRPVAKSFEARADGLGPAVVPNLPSYVDQTFTYSLPNAPIGYDIGEGSVRVLPPYRSGYKVIVGSDYSLTVVGRLVDRDGKPLALVAGEATEDGNDKKSITVFTNQDGRFALSGARVGQWHIRMKTTPELDYSVTLTSSENFLLKLGDIPPISGEGGK